jgi:hypothetical protein
MVLVAADDEQKELAADAEKSMMAAREAQLSLTGTMKGRALSGLVVAVHTGVERSGWRRAGMGVGGNEQKVGEEGGTRT